MNPYEKLRRRLDAKGISLGAIRINETPSDGTYCILNYGGEIETFYFERGIKSDVRMYKREDEAISEFEEWVTSQKHIYKNWDGVVR